MKTLLPGTALLVVIALGGTSCGDGTSDPKLPPQLEFSTQIIDMVLEREALVDLVNTGGQAVGPVQIQPGLVRDQSGATVAGSRVLASPGEIPTLNPGQGSTVELTLSLPGTLQPGQYDAVVTARAESGTRAELVLHFLVPTDEQEAAATLVIGPVPGDLRRGDVAALSVEVRDTLGALLEGAEVTWSVGPAGAGFVGGNGQFVGYASGTATLTARSGSAADTVSIEVLERGVEGTFTLVGQGEERARYTSDLWLAGGYAYTGTWSTRATVDGFHSGNTMYAWDVANPALPVKVDSVRINARTVNDVKVRADGTLAVITHEGSDDGLNGVTLLSLADPAHPTLVGRFDDRLQPGVHNTWLEGDYAYLVVDGIGSGLRILDISDPAQPRLAASYYAGTSFLHDVYVRDGLAFLAHWNAGLVILDVGNGVAGGSPESPVEVSRLWNLGGETHNAWYWPGAGYVFVGEEDFGTPGRMHVVDVRNVREPREVATFQVPGQTPHNFWLDEDREILYLAWYGQGIRALDVSGELLGELDRQGREIAGLRYSPGPGVCDRTGDDTCTWAPQLYRGLVWVADMNNGLLALQPSF